LRYKHIVNHYVKEQIHQGFLLCDRLPEVLREEDDWMNLLTRDTPAGNLGQTAEDELRQIPFLNKQEENYHSEDQQGFSIRF
jgi:hypothetical protein